MKHISHYLKKWKKVVSTKEFVYIGLEKETAEKLKKIKPLGLTMTGFIDTLLRGYEKLK